MSSRRPSIRLYVALAGAVLFATASGFAISACSSSTSDSPGKGDAAAEASGGDSGRPKIDAADTPTDAAKPETTQQCVARCDKEHPASVKKYDAIDQCWTDNCDDPCNNKKGFDAGGEDAAALEGGTHVTDGGGLCGTQVGSGQAQACDDCTSINCCAEWRGCYADKDCQALDDCYQACP